MTLATTLAATALLALPALQAPAPAGEQDALLRFHDLRAVAPHASGAGFSIFAFPIVEWEEEQEPFGLEAELDVDFVAELVLELYGAEFEYEGRGIEVLGDGRLMVLAPADVQARVARLLEALQLAIGATTEITVDLVRSKDLPPGLATTGLLSEAQVAPLLEHAARSGGHERYTLRVGPGRPGVVDLGRRVQLMSDFDVEVAERSYIFDPVGFEIDLGTRLALRAAPGPGGLHLSLVLRRTQPAGEVREKSTSRTAMLVSESGSSTQVESLVHQELDVLGRSWALSTFLPEGRALALESRLALAGVSESEVVLLRRSGPALAPSKRLTTGDDGTILTLVDLSTIDPPSTLSSLGEDLGDLPRSIPLPPHYGWRLVQTLLPGSAHDRDAEGLYWWAFEASGREADWVSSWPWLAVRETLHEGGPSAHDARALVSALAPDARLVQVALTLREKGAEGKLLARLALPLRSGERSSALLGVEGQRIADVDVEIAKHAAVEDPILGRSFDGLIVELEPRLDAAGGLMLDLQALAGRSDRDTQKLTYNQRRSTSIEQRGSTQLLLREQLRFPASGGRSASVLLGDVAGSLVLEVEARW